MRLRRGLALVMTVVALATVMTSAAAATADTKPTICVALVVDGSSLGSNVSTSCAKVPKGATGVDVLEAGGHRVGFRNDGLLCTIDGLPKGGCETVDDSHYWAYFHRAPGATKWTYSSEGPATYQPVNRSTEGWVYDDGKALTPDNVPYPQICTPTATPSHPISPATAAPTPTPTPHPSTTPSPRHRSKRPRPGPRASASPATGVALPTLPSPSPTSAVLAGAVLPPSNHNGRLDLLIGLVVVAALAVSAAIRFRRARP